MANKKFSVLISKENSPPYYIQVPIWARNFIFYVFPFLFLLMIFMSLINFNIVKLTKKPSAIKKDIQKEKNLGLTKQLNELEAQNLKLRNKILNIGSSPSSESEALKFNFIKLPQTFQDISAKNIINLSRWQWDYSDNLAKLSFQIVNKKKGKTRGFLFVIQYTQAGYQVYPVSNHSEVLFQKSYLEGDSFNVSFYKPVSIKFPLNKNTKSVHYLVIALSVDGDLLYEKNYGPYQL